MVKSTLGTTPTHQIDDQLESETHNNKKRQKERKIYMYIYAKLPSRGGKTKT